MKIVLKKVRVHNLKDVDLELDPNHPRTNFWKSGKEQSPDVSHLNAFELA